ncbi:MAG: arginine--tRNA ligase [Cyanobacteriota bacterium]|jgi:arginyl-tRNA synthetase
MLSVLHVLRQQLQDAMERAFPEAAVAARAAGQPLDPQLEAASKPEFGDFQANGALPLAKPLGQAPRAIAMAVVQQLAANPAFETLCLPPQVAGPGFINLTVRPTVLAAEVRRRVGDPRLGVPMATGPLAPVIVDFSSPNIAKEMHVGHLRSTIIGDALARVLDFRGHPVLRLNHVGDWGTQFGMLITHLKEVAPEALGQADVLNLGDLVSFYRQAKQRFDADPAFQAASREEVVKLQGGNPLSLKAWTLLCEQSRKEFQQIYDRLGIVLQERGESFYNPFLPSVVADLRAAGLVVDDGGAACVFLDPNQPPVIVQKSDGGFNYATTDLAAIRYRFAKPPQGDGAQRLIYVTDAGQANHFAAVFAVARRAGWVPDGGRLEHVPFGLVQGEDGKKLKTRSGDTVRLKDLLDEAVQRAEGALRARLAEEGRQEEDPFIDEVATKVGLGAVKYADLATNRLTNYQFSFDRMLALQGNTAPYLLYAVVRLAGIVRRGGETAAAQPMPDPLVFSDPLEWTLARDLLRFDTVIVEVESDLLPNRLCSYLFELSQSFNRFYDQVPVLKAQGAEQGSRLALCRLCADTLRLGLGLLGIETLSRM